MAKSISEAELIRAIDAAVEVKDDFDQLVVAMMLWKLFRSKPLTNATDNNTNPRILGQNADIGIQALRVLRTITNITPERASNLRHKFMELMGKLDLVVIHIESVEWKVASPAPKKSAKPSKKPAAAKRYSKPNSKNKKR